MSDKKNAIRRLHAAMANTGDSYIKDEIKQVYGVRSTTEMSEYEINEAIRVINARTGYYQALRNEDMRLWRSKILSALQSMGIYAHEGDFGTVNAFLTDRRVAGKLLYEMSFDELKACYRRIQMIKKRETDTAVMLRAALNTPTPHEKN